MAAHMSSMHISSEYTPHSLASEERMDVGMEPVTEKLKGHTIVLSEELKKLQEEPLLPASLIERCCIQYNTQTPLVFSKHCFSLLYDKSFLITKEHRIIFCFFIQSKLIKFCNSFTTTAVI